MKTLLCFTVLIAIALAAPADVNVTGNWSGTFNMTRPDGTSREGTALLILKQNGTEITGTVGPGEEERHQIAKGKIDGAKISLEVQDNESVIKFDLIIAGDRIKGDVNIARDGETRKAKIDVGRK